MLFEFLAKKAQEEETFSIDYEGVLGELDSALPRITAKIEIEQVNPPPYKLPRLKFGKLMPKEKDDKKKKKPPAKSKAKKKEENPRKPTKWADMPEKPEP